MKPYEFEGLTLTEMKQEIWKDIEGYEGIYQRSNMDNVKSLARKGRLKDIILKKIPREYGFVFNLCKDNTMEQLYIPYKNYKHTRKQKRVTYKNYTSKVMTDYKDNQLTKKEVVAKRRLEIAVNARNKMLALRTFKKSKLIRKFK